jgi:hypothetical protein
MLCVAKDETCVVSCAEGFVVDFVEKSIMTNLADETIDARCVSCVYIYTHIHTYA